MKIESEYGANSLISSRKIVGAGISGRFDFAYNAQRKLTEINRFRDLAGTNRIGRTVHTFDANGRVTGALHQNQALSNLFNHTFGYNPGGELVTENQGGDASSYAYDAAGQVTSATLGGIGAETFSYDLNGNRNSAGYQTSNPNRTVQDSTFNYTYDVEGNLVSKLERATNEVTLYDYDHRNRLVRAAKKNSGGSILQTVEFVYDVRNRRVAKLVDGAPQYYLYNGEDVWADYNASKQVIALYIHGDSIDEMLARYTEGEGLSSYLVDHLGTVTGIVNNAGGLATTYRYRSFGEIASVSSPDSNRYTFTAREFDPELGLYYYRARFYDPKFGKFLSEDPIRFSARDLNLYRYVGNSPRVGRDPTGMTALSSQAFMTEAVVITVAAVLVTHHGRELCHSGAGFQACAVAKRGGIGPAGALIFAQVGNVMSLHATSPGRLITRVLEPWLVVFNRKTRSEEPEAQREDTPETAPDNFENVRGTEGKKHTGTDEVWVKDRFHKDHYEVYKNTKQFENGNRDRSVWSNGVLKERF